MVEKNSWILSFLMKQKKAQTLKYPKGSVLNFCKVLLFFHLSGLWKFSVTRIKQQNLLANDALQNKLEGCTVEALERPVKTGRWAGSDEFFRWHLFVSIFALQWLKTKPGIGGFFASIKRQVSLVYLLLYISGCLWVDKRAKWTRQSCLFFLNVCMWLRVYGNI